MTFDDALAVTAVAVVALVSLVVLLRPKDRQ